MLQTHTSFIPLSGSLFLSSMGASIPTLLNSGVTYVDRSKVDRFEAEVLRTRFGGHLLPQHNLAHPDCCAHLKTYH